jgi:hypothetical protein
LPWWAWLGGRPAALLTSVALVLLVVGVLRPLEPALKPAPLEAAQLESFLELSEPLDAARQRAGLYDAAPELKLEAKPAVSQWDLLERSSLDPFAVFEHELSKDELAALRAELGLELG